PQPNQIARKRDDVRMTAADLLAVPEGAITEAGLRTNVSVGVQYLEAWLGGLAAVPLYNLMEDAATAEISRTPIWQWIHHPQDHLADGRTVRVELVRQVLAEELGKLKSSLGEDTYNQRHFTRASELFDNLATSDELQDFLTLPAYAYLE